MKVTQLEIADVLLVEPVVHRDGRGFFTEVWQQERYAQAGIAARFVQDNHSASVQDTLRGLHAQLRRPQGKLVRCVEGRIYDVAVDLRPASPTFGRWVGATLDDQALNQIYIPEGFAHGFCVLSARAQVEYKTTAPYDPGGEITLRWDDPRLAIHWPVKKPLLSPKDAAAPTLAQLEPRLRPSGA